MKLVLSILLFSISGYSAEIGNPLFNNTLNNKVDLIETSPVTISNALAVIGETSIKGGTIAAIDGSLIENFVTLKLSGTDPGTTGDNFGFVILGEPILGRGSRSAIGFTNADGNKEGGADLRFYTGTADVTERMIIEAGGNIGIGETDPAEKLQISSSATSGYSLGFAGAFVTLPTSGHEEGTLAYQTSDHTLYISTNAVDEAGDWKPVW